MTDPRITGERGDDKNDLKLRKAHLPPWLIKKVNWGRLKISVSMAIHFGILTAVKKLKMLKS